MKLNIVTKINLFVCLLIISSTIFLGWFFLHHESEAIEKELGERAKTIVNNLAYNCEYGVLVGDKDELKRLLEGISKEKDVSFVKVENQGREILAQVGNDSHEGVKIFSAEIVSRSQTQDEKGFDALNGHQIEKKAEVIGRVQINLSLGDLSKKTSQLKKIIILMVAIVIIFSIAGALFGLHYFIKRIRQAEEKLETRSKELEYANKELKDFSSVVSHDLKAPLRSIHQLATWIVEDYAEKIDEEGRERLNLLVKRVERLDNLIMGVLQYSRAGRSDTNDVEIDLKKLIQDVIGAIAPPKNIQIIMDDYFPMFYGDITRIQQLFQNLISNAVKYIDKPQGEIKLGCREEGSFWKFFVSDNGPGIEKQYFERIFKIFQTLAPKDERESTGVGLTVAKKIVELYGGQIWLESELAVGTTFYFTLPKKAKK